MTSKTNQNSLRKMLLRDGTVKASTAPSEFKHRNVQESRLSAIAARRNELRPSGKTTGDSKRSQAGYTLVELIFAIGGISAIVVLLGLLYVAFHFINKYW